MNSIVFNTPIGALKADEEGGFLTGLTFYAPYAQETDSDNDVLKETKKQLSQYFLGERKEFDLPLKLNVTPYRKKVLEELLKVGYGETVSYGKLAERTGNPKAFRAVGSAMRTNPIMIIVPCHRVLPSTGKVGNYSGGGPANKEWLLTFEKQNSRHILL